MMALLEEWSDAKGSTLAAKDGLHESSSRYLARRGRVCWLDFFPAKRPVSAWASTELSSDVQPAQLRTRVSNPGTYTVYIGSPYR